MELSIVIPAFDERNKIAGDVKSAADFLAASSLTGQTIIVDDGSSDDTAEIARAAEHGEIPLEVIRYEQNRGKGYAIKTGIAASTGDFVMFADCGCCVPYEDALTGLKLLKTGEVDIAHGSRAAKESVICRPRNTYRKTLSKLFRIFTTLWLNIPPELSDTQCGFKLYRGDIARKLYADCVTEGFMFDIEIILRAGSAGYRIKEFPIRWAWDHDSRLSMIRHGKEILTELAIIRKTLHKK